MAVLKGAEGLAAGDEFFYEDFFLHIKMVGDTRIELATSRPPGVRATTALIPDKINLVGPDGIEPSLYP